MDLLGAWDYAIGLDRFVLYTSALLASGLALFTLVLDADEERVIATAGGIASAVAAVSMVLTIGVGGAAMMSGDFFVPGTWVLAARTTLGSSGAAGFLGAVMLLVSFPRGPFGGRRVILALGAVITLASFLMTGHAATAPPEWLMGPIVGIHLLAASFWFGALLPLYAAVRSKSLANAGILMDRFSRLAVIGVALLVISGAAITWVQTDSLTGLFNTPYGYRLLVKLGLFVGLLGLATYNKLVLTPGLQNGLAVAAGGMRRSIAVELVLYVGILAIAAFLSVSAPPRG